jgi:tetratricopeptide (TPR) repeat protein
MYHPVGMRGIHALTRCGPTSSAHISNNLLFRHTLRNRLPVKLLLSPLCVSTPAFGVTTLTPQRYFGTDDPTRPTSSEVVFETGALSEKDLIELSKEATEAFEKGEFLAAIEAWEKVAQSKQHTPNSPTLLSCLNNLACAYGEVGDNVRKLKLLERSRDLVKNVYGTDHPQYGMVLYNMACAKEEMGLYNDMKELLDESLALHERRFNPRHAKVGRVLLLVAAAQDHLGEHDAQVKTAERAYEIVKRHCGPDHVQTTIAMMTLARAYGAVGLVERQLQLTQAAFNVQEKRLGPKNPQLAMTLMELAEAHKANKDYHNQRALLEEAVEVQRRSFGQQHTHLVDTYIALGDACGLLDDTTMQAQYYLEALKVARQRFQGKHIAIGKAELNAARAYLLQGNLKKASQLLDDARFILERNVSPVHPLSKQLEEVSKQLQEKTK